MNAKRKEDKLKHIARLYLLSLSTIESVTYSYPQSKLLNFRNAVELAYASLNAPLRRIINNDFFYQDYPDWWKLLYKKNEYQKLKNEAIISFLEAFYAL